MLRAALPLVLALGGAACSAQISDGGGAHLGTLDAGDPADAPGVPVVVDGGAAACASRVVFLNFEGQTLFQGPSDATQNQASWLNKTIGTAPRYHAGSATRDADILNIVDHITQQLAQFPVTVVTKRPAAGSYVMLVFGGTANDVGSNYGAAVNTLDCGDTRPNDVAWLADNLAPQRAINTAIGAIGFGLGLTATSDTKDCMCGWANNCQANNSVACNLGAPIARDPGAGQLCPGAGASQDEVATIRKAFCG
jgi:hypothetical protein